MQSPKDIAEKVFQFEMFDMFGEDEIISVLKAADDLYFNVEESFITDGQYDALRLYASKAYPTNDYFGQIGAAVRGGKIDLPYPMGSLDQIQIGEIVAWITRWRLPHEYILLSDKLDGTSALVIYDKRGRLKIAYSRGDGLQGADITRHIKHLVPPRVSGPMSVRGEVIIPKSKFDNARLVAKKRDGSDYKNARNMVAGLMNATKNPQGVYQHIDFLAYQILDDDNDKLVMLHNLSNEGFKVPHHDVKLGGLLTDEWLADYLEARRDTTDYEIDGLVLDANDAKVRVDMNPTRDTLNPAYSIKYKVADASNLANAIVVKVHWAISKHGYLKPRIEIEPVDLVGVTITFCTGFNAAFIVNNKIGPGAEIEITRSGDVIPYCQKVISGTTAQLPGKEIEDWGYGWAGESSLFDIQKAGIAGAMDSGDRVDFQLKKHLMHPEVQIQQMLDFFSSIDAPLLKEGTVRKLYENGYDTIESVIRMDKTELVRIIGNNGEKIYTGLKNVLTDIPLYKIAGAHSMERGVGVRSMKSLQKDLGKDKLLRCNDVDLIAQQNGFSDTTAKAVVRALNRFWMFLVDVNGYVTIAEEKDTSGGALHGKKVVFTGFRDKVLQAQIEDAGGTMQSSVSGKTNIVVTTNPSGNSSKLRKARDLGLEILSVDEMRGLL